jgi:hypothetical protein
MDVFYSCSRLNFTISGVVSLKSFYYSVFDIAQLCQFWDTMSISVRSSLRFWCLDM